jgi:hypothetical protein
VFVCVCFFHGVVCMCLRVSVFFRGVVCMCLCVSVCMI